MMVAREGELKRPSTRFLVRHVIPSGDHSFVGRVFDLSIVAYHFDTWEEMAKHPDCKYALEVNSYVTALVDRVESLNLVGEMLWPDPFPENFQGFPVSRYEWLTIALDVFLMRLVSVFDCALLLTDAVCETGFEPRKCSIKSLAKKSVPQEVLDVLRLMHADYDHLRKERNSRIHEGVERSFTEDDLTFRTVSMFEKAWVDQLMLAARSRKGW